MRKTYWIIGLVFGSLLALASILLDPLRGDPFSFGRLQLLVFSFGFVVFLVSGYSLFPSESRRIMSFIYQLSKVAFIAGTLLLLLNLVGLVIGIRHPQSAIGFQYAGKYREIGYSADEVMGMIERVPSEKNEEYAYRLTETVFNGAIHYWILDGNQDTQVPIYENFVLWYQTRNGQPYEFCDPYKAIQRGVGVCSQFSKILVSVMAAEGLGAHSYALEGHVVAEIEIETDTWWVLDSDYGVVIEYSIEYLEQHPELVHDAYIDAGYDERIAEKLSVIYGPEGNYIEGNTGFCAREAKSYQQKWQIPAWLISPFIVMLLLNNFVLKGFFNNKNS